MFLCKLAVLGRVECAESSHAADSVSPDAARKLSNQAISAGNAQGPWISTACKEKSIGSGRTEVKSVSGRLNPQDLIAAFHYPYGNALAVDPAWLMLRQAANQRSPWESAPFEDSQRR